MMASLQKLLPLVVTAVVLFLNSSPTDAERHKQVVAALSHCSLNCLNDGYCDYTKYTDYPRKGDVGYYQSCTCRPGFGGGSCEKIVEECQPPLYQCSNGAPCEVDETGSLGCDCSAADDKSEAGYMCRNPAIVECNTLDENNKSYCTNGGICLSSMKASPSHLMFSGPTVHEGCKCNDALFTGEHCEFLKDMPQSTLVASQSTGAKAGITLSIMATIAIICTVIITRRRKQLRVSMGQSWKIGEDKFRQFYSDNLANERTRSGGIDEDNECNTDIEFDDEEEDDKLADLREEEQDLSAMLSNIHDDSSEGAEVFEDGTKAEFV